MVQGKKKNHKWKRVITTRMDDGQYNRMEKNTNMMKDSHFQKACENFNVQPTRRQASKWNRKIGLAYKSENNMI